MPISNGLLKSLTDRYRISNGLWSPLPIISYWRRMLVGCISFAGDQIGCVSGLRIRLLWLPPRVAFFSHIGDARCYCSSTSSPSDTTRSLSAEGHSCSYNNTRSRVLRSPRRPIPFAAASCARSEDHAEFLSSESQRCSRPAGRMRNGERVQSGRRPRRPPCCRGGRDAASNPPPRPRSPRRKSS
jgi:hypothetical protein